MFSFDVIKNMSPFTLFIFFCNIPYHIYFYHDYLDYFDETDKLSFKVYLFSNYGYCYVKISTPYFLLFLNYDFYDFALKIF